MTRDEAITAGRALKVGVRGEDVTELQRFLIAAGYLSPTDDAGRPNADGIYGRNTARAVAALLASAPLPPAPPPPADVDEGMYVAFRRTVANVFRAWARQGIRETSHNRGPMVDAIIEYGGGDKEDRGAWCARAVSAAARIAADACCVRLVTPISGAVRSLWQRSASSRITRAEILAGAPVLEGDVLIRTRAARDAAEADTGSWLGHCGVAVEDYRYAEDQPWIPSGEGNTDGEEAEEGNGVFEKRRGMSVQDPRFVGVVRLRVANY